MSERSFGNERNFEMSETVEAVLKEAFGLRKEYEGEQAIWKALDTFRIKDRRERIRLFRLIKPVFARRVIEEKENERLEKEGRFAMMLEEAAEAERQMPQDE
jgi:hypothetical protein